MSSRSSAGHYTVDWPFPACPPRRLRRASQSSTGIHLGEVVKVEQEIVVVCPIEPGDPIGIGDTVIRKGAFRIAPTESWCGRTINSLGEPIDGKRPDRAQG
jgi:flagellar biosynthesis/type III secretory pathway ATPase